MPKATRSEVYAAIDTERAYEDRFRPNPMTLGEFILLIEEYAARARRAWAEEAKSETDALDTIRKITGIGVNCMEQHGAPIREDKNG